MDFIGTYKIMFVGREEYSQVELEHFIQDAIGHPIYLVGTDGAIYNWSNVIMMIKVSQ